MEQIFEVKGMTCGHCERAVTQAVQSVDVSAKVIIDRSNNQVQVESEAPRASIQQAIAEEGYAVSD